MGIHEIYAFMGARSRQRRLVLLSSVLSKGAETTILDVGGTPEFWRNAGRVGLITLVNVTAPRSADTLPSWMEFRLASGVNLPFEDKSFDVVFSNSTIEHLGSLAAQRCFAREVARVGRTYFVQTPSIAFPVEPHYLTPFIHWLPKTLRRRLVRHFTLWAWITRPSQSYVNHMVDEIRLLSRSEFSSLFPDGPVLTERFFLWPKSMIAIGRHTLDSH